MVQQANDFLYYQFQGLLTKKGLPVRGVFEELRNKRFLLKGLLQCTGFSDSSSSDRLTEEQENEIAENIYDWWISGKSYKQWYAERFQQLKIDFGEES